MRPISCGKGSTSNISASVPRLKTRPSHDCTTGPRASLTAVCLAVVAIAIALYSRLSTNVAINEEIDRTALTYCRFALLENFETTIKDYSFYLRDGTFAPSNDVASETSGESDANHEPIAEWERDWLVSGAATSMANSNVKILYAESIPEGPPVLLGPVNDRAQARQYRDDYGRES